MNHHLFENGRTTYHPCKDGHRTLRRKNNTIAPALITIVYIYRISITQGNMDIGGPNKKKYCTRN